MVSKIGINGVIVEEIEDLRAFEFNTFFLAICQITKSVLLFVVFLLAFFASMFMIRFWCSNLDFLTAVHTHNQFLTAFFLYFLLSALKAFSSDESFINSGSTLTTDGFVVKLFG